MVCPTPVGITATGNMEAAATYYDAHGAQRLSASQQRGTPHCPGTVYLSDVPNACRHHSNGEPADCASSAHRGSCAQRLSASQQRGTFSRSPRTHPVFLCPTPVGITATGNILRRTRDCASHPVPNACRHHSNGEPSLRLHHDTLQHVPNACRHHSNGERGNCSRRSRGAHVPNACRHHSNGEPDAATPPRYRPHMCPTPVGITATGNGAPDWRAHETEVVPNACRHHSNGEPHRHHPTPADGRQVPNACRHHSNGEQSSAHGPRGKESEVPNACRHHSNGEPVVLAGNSVHFDLVPNACRHHSNGEHGPRRRVERHSTSAQRLSASQQRGTVRDRVRLTADTLVPNACRHHSNGELQVLGPMHASIVCPTPVGITATGNNLASWANAGTRPGAQRLSASQQRGTMRAQLDLHLRFVPNACRHHSNGELYHPTCSR